MTGTSIAKDLYRLMRRIRPLTDGQASIDDVKWDDGDLTSFGVTIRPNASFYKGGRSKFTITIPDGYIGGECPKIWCETEIPHPNIDTFRTYSNGSESTNICLSLWDSEDWHPAHGLEGLVLGILFLMHHPNLDSTLVGGFPDGDPEGVAKFAEYVKSYMATGECNNKIYNIDFRVINGKFIDLNDDSGNELDNDSEMIQGKTKVHFPELVVEGFNSEEKGGDIVPVRFDKVKYDPENCDEYYEGYFYMTFAPVDPNNDENDSITDSNDTTQSKDDSDRRNRVSHSESLDYVEIGISDCT